MPGASRHEFTPVHRGGSGESPLVLVHGFTDTWRTWELVLPELERHHDVLAVTLPGHAGGPPLPLPMTETTLVEGIEAAMDAAGFGSAHVAGNSLGGFVALQLAERQRARSVTALAPAGGWAPDDPAQAQTMRFFAEMDRLVKAALPHAEEIAATPEGRRRATLQATVNYEHIPPELIVHMMRGAAGCTGLTDFLAFAGAHGYPLDAERIQCPVRIVWGTEDQLLAWPQSAVRYRKRLLPHADWVVIDGLGHCLQLDSPVEVAQLILGQTEAGRTTPGRP
jgi:pimeloyl-ACP methyl ester carboxylesterase